MKFLHTSDWHLGRVLHERSLLDDQRAFLGQLERRLRDDPHDALLLAGDVFDRSIPPEAAVELFSSFLASLRVVAASMPVVVIAGNHDSGSRLSYLAELLSGVGVHLRGDASALDRPVVVRGRDGDEAEIFCVPFLHPGALTSHREGEELPVATQESALAEALGRIRAARTPGRRHVVVAHCFVAGGTVSDSERTLVGQATQVGASLFAGFDYVALGHLHRPQRIADAIHYSGSPLPYSFSEAGDEKALLSVELRGAEGARVTRLPIDLPRRMVVLRGSLDELCHAPRYQAHVDDYVRAELTDVGALTSPFALLRKRFPLLLSLEVVRDAGDALSGAADATGTSDVRRDLEDDFVAFEQLLHDGTGPTSAVLTAFRAVRAELDRGEDR